MRIRGGNAKGQVIQAPKGYDTRPTSDKVKEAIFNVVALKLENAGVLDLCAGSGNLGLEALSRGAHKVDFVEKNSKACNAIIYNITKLGFTSGSKLHKLDALKALGHFLASDHKFDIIFFDPPYQAGLYQQILHFLASEGRSLLKENGVLVVECSAKNDLPEAIYDLVVQKTSIYGDTKVLYYQF